MWLALPVTTRNNAKEFETPAWFRRGVMHARRINISFAFISATLPLSTQLLKPFDGARLPRDGREQPRRKQFRRPQKPPLVSPSSLPFQFHPPSSVRPHYLPRDMTTTIIKCVARAAPSRTNDHRNCTMGFRGEMASLRTLRSSTPQDIEQRDQKLLLPRANCSPLFSHAMRVIARRQNGDGCRVVEGHGTGD